MRNCVPFHAKPFGQGGFFECVGLISNKTEIDSEIKWMNLGIDGFTKQAGLVGWLMPIEKDET